MNDSPASNAPLIAVVGMAGRFPGARKVNEFWRNLRDGVESISPLDDYQLQTAGVSPAELADLDYVRAAAILDDFDRFDAAFFGFSPKEDAAIMDPQHRLFLECAWEALENAGWCPDELDGRIGVYAGSGMNAYLIHNLLTNPALLAETGLFLLKQTGNDKDVLATRVSCQLNLTGPSLAVQTACSTSLVAIHLASQSLLNRECDMALAAGVTIEVPHGRGYIYREREIDPKSVCSDAARETPPSITFLFPSQGSQYVAMGQELDRDEPVFRTVLDSCAEKLQPLLDLDLRTGLFPTETATEDQRAQANRLLDETRLTQPALFVVEFRASDGMGAVDDRYGWDLGWGRLAQAGVDVHEVTSDHLGILREPSVRELAREIAACLEKCWTPEEHSSTPTIVMSAQFDRPSVGLSK